MSAVVDRDPADGERTNGLTAVGTDAPLGKLATQVAHRIEATVMRQGWPVGKLLGSEVDLRDQFGVSRAVVREAVRLVEHHQVARMRRGPNGGLVVCAPDSWPATRAVVIYLEYVGTSVEDLLEARLLLEPIAAALAADRITEERIDTLRSYLDREFGRLEEPGERSQDSLHPLLGELSGNPVLHLFIDVLSRLTARYAHTSRRLSKSEVLSGRKTSHAAHRAIVDAVITGDGARAQTTLTAHLESVAAWIDTHRVRRARRGPASAGNGVEPDIIIEGTRVKLAETVAARIQDDIALAGWQVGLVLGSEADLLARYGISRAVLREAVRLLEYHQVATMRRGPGGGLIVTKPEPQASIDAMALFLGYRSVTGDDLGIVRNAIELGNVNRVIARHTDGDAEVGERLARAVRWSTEGPAGDPRKVDLFHDELSRLAGNPVLSLFLSIITELIRRHAASHDRPLPGDEEAVEVQRVHQHILDAILQEDTGVALHRMRSHLDALLPWWH